jgi:hypothetical protein
MVFDAASLKPLLWLLCRSGGAPRYAVLPHAKEGMQRNDDLGARSIGLAAVGERRPAFVPLLGPSGKSHPPTLILSSSPNKGNTYRGLVYPSPSSNREIPHTNPSRRGCGLSVLSQAAGYAHTISLPSLLATGSTGDWRALDLDLENEVRFIEPLDQGMRHWDVALVRTSQMPSSSIARDLRVSPSHVRANV